MSVDLRPQHVWVDARQPCIFRLHGLAQRQPLLGRTVPFDHEFGSVEQAGREVERCAALLCAGPVDQPWPLRGQDHIAGVQVAVGEAVILRQAINQGEDAGRDGRRDCRLGEPQRAVHIVADGQKLRYRTRLVRRSGEGRQDGPGVGNGHGVRQHLFHQSRAVEAWQHDPPPTADLDLVQHLRRRSACGEDRAGHARLPSGDPARNPRLEQLDDLPRRPGVDVRHGAFAELFPECSDHRPAPPDGFDRARSTGHDTPRKSL